MASACCIYQNNRKNPTVLQGKKLNGNLNLQHSSMFPKKIRDLMLGRQRQRQSDNPVYKSESFRFLQKTDSFIRPVCRRSFKVPVSENYVDPIDRENGKEEPPYHEITEKYNAPYYYSDTIKEPTYCSPCSVQRPSNNEETENMGNSNISVECKSSQSHSPTAIKVTINSSPSLQDSSQDTPFLTRRHQFISICQIRNSPSSTMTSDCVKRLIRISDKNLNILDYPRQPFHDCDTRRRLAVGQINSSNSNSLESKGPYSSLSLSLSSDQELSTLTKNQNQNQILPCDNDNFFMSTDTNSQLNNQHYQTSYGLFCFREEPDEPFKSESKIMVMAIPSTTTTEEFSSRSSTISCVDSGICLDDTMSLSLHGHRHGHGHGHGRCKTKVTSHDKSSKNVCEYCSCCDRKNEMDHFYTRVGGNGSTCSNVKGGGGNSQSGVRESQHPHRHDHRVNECANQILDHDGDDHKRSEKVAPRITHNEQQQMCNLVDDATLQMIVRDNDRDLLRPDVAPHSSKLNYIKAPCYVSRDQTDLAHQYQLALNPSVKLENQDWFHGRITRIEAESILKPTKPKSFLVRNCEKSKENHFSLSIKCSSGFVHIRIEPNPRGTYTLAEQEFPSVPHLIQCFMHHRLPIKGTEHLKLVYPVITQFL